MIKLNPLVATLLGSSLFLNAAVAAPVYQFAETDPNQNNRAGMISDYSVQYDVGNETFSWSHTIEDVGSQASNGFWLVVSDGPNPKGYVDELAIFYGDAVSETLSAYVYTGQNNSNSWVDSSAYINTFALDYQDNGNSGTYTFSIDASGINSHFNTVDWKGSQFEDSVGLWFHPMLGASFNYAANGTISSLNFGQQGWVDYSNKATHEVPEANSFMLFLLGLMGFGFTRALMNVRDNRLIATHA